MFSLYKKIKIQNLPLCLYNNTAELLTTISPSLFKLMSLHAFI